MAAENRTNLKSHFQTGDIPTEQHFSNLIDSFHHKEDASEQSSSNTLFFHNAFAGVTHGTWVSPITGPLVIDQTNAVDGGVVAIIWQGDSNPSFSGGLINTIVGNISQLGIHTIYIHRINGRYNINIMASAAVDTVAPSTPNLLSVDGGSPAIDTTPPATPNLLTAADGAADIAPPATPNLISAT